MLILCIHQKIYEGMMMRAVFSVILMGICSLSVAQNLIPLQPPIDPIGNPSSPDKIMLGKVLYWDEQLSSTKTVSCASCHILSNGGTDPRATATNIQAINPGADMTFATADDVIGSPGVPQSCQQGDYLDSIYGYEPQVTGRKSPSSINAGYSETLFWDGRADDQLIDPLTGELVLSSGAALENQAIGPPTSTEEMGHVGRSWSEVINTLEKSSPLALSPLVPADLSDWIGLDSYYQLFAKVYGETTITPAKVAMAIASYERSLYANQTPFDAFIAGDNNAMTQQERRGFNVFRTAGCQACHSGSLLTNNDFHNTGVTPNNEDQGRFDVTGLNRDMGRFKTSPLRGLASQTSYMHNGGFSTIEEVIEFYDRGGDFNNPNLDNRMRPLNLSAQQKADLAAFLGRPLTDPRVVNETGPFTSPLLFSESNRVPSISGSGIAGTDGKVPAVIAIEPPIVGNRSFTIAVYNALGNSQAVFIADTSDPGLANPPEQQDSLIYQTTTLKSHPDNNDGHISQSIILDGDQLVNGTELFGRWYISDPNAENGYAISPLVTFTLFAPGFGTAGQIFSSTFEPQTTVCQ